MASQFVAMAREKRSKRPIFDRLRRITKNLLGKTFCSDMFVLLSHRQKKHFYKLKF